MRRIVFSLVIATLLDGAAVLAAEYTPSKRLGISLATLQQSLGKVDRSVVFAPRPGSAQGTQEARLPNKAGVVQASGDQDNLAAVVLWMPVDQQKKRIDLGSRGYLDALMHQFVSGHESVVLWVDQVLQRAFEESPGASHLESQLFDTYQLKAMYVPSMSPPMLSLTVTTSDDQ